MSTIRSMAVTGGHRDGLGRFTKGCPGGPGNPYVRQVAQLKAALYEALSESDIAAVAQTMVKRAVEGDVAAARLVLEYAVGKPVSGALASALDGEMMHQLNYDALSVEELRTLLTIQQKLEKSAVVEDELDNREP